METWLSFLARFLVIFFFVLITPTLKAETITFQLLYQKNGSAIGDRLGSSVSSAGDVNGDGKADFIIGAPLASGGGQQTGSAYVYSGATGVLLHQKNGFPIFAHLGSSVSSVGDVDGDGKTDFIIGASGTDLFGFLVAGSAYVFSGATGSLLYRKDGSVSFESMGWSVSSAGDINGDGRADFITGGPFATRDGRQEVGSAYVYSGNTGVLLYQKNGSVGAAHVGFSVSSAGDVNGDGRSDFIIGAPHANPGGLSAGGSAFLYSGMDGTLLFQLDGTAAGENLGTSVAGAGDVNGDGRSEFIIGAPHASPGGLSAGGSAFLYSGMDGILLFQIDGAAPGDLLGSAVAGAGDINGDGRADFIIGAPGADSGRGSAYVYGILGCTAVKGDMNGDASLTVYDVVLMINCVFLAQGICDLCFADLNCNGMLTPAEVVILLNMVYLAAPPGCGP